MDKPVSSANAFTSTFANTNLGILVGFLHVAECCVPTDDFVTAVLFSFLVGSDLSFANPFAAMAS